MAEQECADGTMADKEDVSRLLSSHDMLDFADNPLLRVDCSLPTPNTGKRLSEKLIGYHLKFDRLQKARRRAVVLMHHLPDFDCNVQFPGNDLTRLSRLSLGT